MLVAVEVTRLQREVRGIGRYVRALLPRLAAQRADLRFALFVKNARDAVSLREIVARDAALRGRADVHLVRGMTRFSADLFWYPWNVARPAPKQGAVVVTVHDIAPVALPDPRWTAWRKNFRWRRLYAATARRATIVLADSAFTGSEVTRMLGVPPERIRVVLLSADDFAVPSSEGDAAALEKLAVRGPYVLAVGAKERRKNLSLLERAVSRLVAAGERVTLVLVGPRRRRRTWWGAAPAPMMPWMQATGFVSDGELAALYRGATALVMPSTYEGFGLPVLEAMRLGAPVVCARASSLPEVGGSAAAYVDPGDDGQLAETLGRLLRDAPFRDTMGAASLEQAKRFSWDETARRTLAAFDDARRLASHE